MSVDTDHVIIYFFLIHFCTTFRPLVHNAEYKKRAHNLAINAKLTINSLCIHYGVICGYMRKLCAICGLMRAAYGLYTTQCTKAFMHKVIQCFVQTRVSHMWGDVV